jgi:hypothetical protein
VSGKVSGAGSDIDGLGSSVRAEFIRRLHPDCDTNELK